MVCGWMQHLTSNMAGRSLITAFDPRQQHAAEKIRGRVLIMIRYSQHTSEPKAKAANDE